MKLTKQQLKQIIKEEIEEVMVEVGLEADPHGFGHRPWNPQEQSFIKKEKWRKAFNKFMASDASAESKEHKLAQAKKLGYLEEGEDEEITV